MDPAGDGNDPPKLDKPGCHARPFWSIGEEAAVRPVLTCSRLSEYLIVSQCKLNKSHHLVARQMERGLNVEKVRKGCGEPRLELFPFRSLSWSWGNCSPHVMHAGRISSLNIWLKEYGGCCCSCIIYSVLVSCFVH